MPVTQAYIWEPLLHLLAIPSYSTITLLDICILARFPGNALKCERCWTPSEPWALSQSILDTHPSTQSIYEWFWRWEGERPAERAMSNVFEFEPITPEGKTLAVHVLVNQSMLALSTFVCDEWHITTIKPPWKCNAPVNCKSTVSSHFSFKISEFQF